MQINRASLQKKKRFSILNIPKLKYPKSEHGELKNLELTRTVKFWESWQPYCSKWASISDISLLVLELQVAKGKKSSNVEKKIKSVKKKSNKNI
jgi:hypothetical protein